jgi:hypothetical protein
VSGKARISAHVQNVFTANLSNSSTSNVITSHESDRVRHSATVRPSMLRICCGSTEQNIVNFLTVLDKSFRLKCAPESIRLRTAMKAINDSCRNHCVTAVPKDLKAISS